MLLKYHWMMPCVCVACILFLLWYLQKHSEWLCTFDVPSWWVFSLWFSAPGNSSIYACHARPFIKHSLETDCVCRWHHYLYRNNPTDMWFGTGENRLEMHSKSERAPTSHIYQVHAFLSLYQSLVFEFLCTMHDTIYLFESTGPGWLNTDFKSGKRDAESGEIKVLIKLYSYCTFPNLINSLFMISLAYRDSLI